MTQYREAMRLQTIWGKILYSAPELCPFLLGPIIFGFRASVMGLAEVFSRYLVFLALFASWSVVKHCAFTLIERRVDSSGAPLKREKLTLVLLVATAILAMIFLQLMQLRVRYEEFVGILVILGLGGLRESLLKKGLLSLSHLLSLIYLTGIGYISISLMIDVLTWQPLFVALGVACMTLAFEILHFLEQHRDRYPFQRNGTPTSKGAKFTRAVPFLLTCGPTFVAVMSYMNELPRAFSAVFLTLLLSSRVITAIKNAEKSGTLVAGLDRQAAGICLLFTVIIAVASYLFF